MSAHTECEIHSASESEIRSLLLQYRRENWQGIQRPEIQEKMVDDLLSDSAGRLLQELTPYVTISAQSRLLDLGSGVGSFVAACAKRGLNCFGAEPDRIGNGAQLTAIQIAKRRVSRPVFVAAVGESLPFADGSFDLVTLNQVIEHVSDQQAVLSEATRVLKEGGAAYIACPNYLRFYEPHYKIVWFPLLPKVLGRLYLRLRGRRPVMLDQITYTTNHRLRKLMDKLGPEYTVLDLHRETFLKKRAEGTFAARSTRFVRTLSYLPLAGPLVLQAILWFASIREGGCEWLVIRKALDC